MIMIILEWFYGYTDTTWNFTMHLDLQRVEKRTYHDFCVLMIATDFLEVWDQLETVVPGKTVV